MSLYRRSLTVATVTVLSLAGLGVNASAEDAPTSTTVPGRPAIADAEPDLAVGLIVKTTTSKLSASLLDVADDALGSDADVEHADPLTTKISTIDFDEAVPTDVAAEAAAEVEKRSDVVWAVPNGIRKATAAPPIKPNDPFFGLQQNLWDSTYASAAYSIKAPSAWQATTGSPSVIVAVLDTGILKNHPDIEGQLVDGYDMVSDQVNDANDWRDHVGRDGDASDPGDYAQAGACGNGSPAWDSSWHGSFVAGQIAAKQNNGVGISGIAPGVKVEPVRVLGRCGGTDADILAGMIWASGGAVDDVPTNQHRAQIVNMSLSGQTSSTAERNEVCEAYADVTSQGAARGTIFVAAAGNDFGNANLAVPAACPGVISVGATSHKGFSSVYSNIGSTVDLSAPGGDTVVEGGDDVIRSIWNSGKTGPSVHTYTGFQGTSMAAPEVSAAAALLYSLGLQTPQEMTNGLYALAAPFRARVSSYANKKVNLGGQTYVFDLNCRGQDWCGRGILNLGRVQAPLSKPTITGSALLGEPLTAKPGTWVGTPSTFRYQWFRTKEGAAPQSIEGATGPTYYPTRDDIDATLSVQLGPTTAAFAKLTTTSVQTEAVPDGPAVTMTGLPSTLKYGVDATTTVTVKDGDTPVDGLVELRRGSTTLASGQTDENGVATIAIAGTQWVAGSNLIRAAFVGTPAASSEGVDVAVTKASSSVTTSLPTSVRYTSRATIGITVKVAGVPKPTGQLRIYDGSKKIVYAVLASSANGKRSIVLPRLSKGYHNIKVVYSGNSVISPKTSRVRKIRSY